MPDIAQIRVKLLADLAELDKMKSQANSAFRQVSAAARRESREAQGALALIGEEIGVRLPRHVRSFVAQLPGVSTALAAAFSTTAVVGVGAAIFEAGKKIAEFVEKQREAAEKLRECQEAFGLTVQQTYNSFQEKLLTAGIRTDELRHDHIDALHKQLQLIDMQGFDNLEAAFEKLEQSADKTFQGIKSNWLSVITQFSFAQASGFQASLQRFGADYSSLLAQHKDIEAQNRLNTTQQREERNRADLITVRNAGIRSSVHSGGVVVGSPVDLAMKRLSDQGITDYSDETYNAARQTAGVLEAMQNIAAVQRQTTAADQHNAVLTAGKGEAADLISHLEEQLSQQIVARAGGTAPVTKSDELSFWKSHLDDFGVATEQYKTVIGKIAELTQTMTAAAHTALDNIRARIKRQREEDAHFNLNNRGWGFVGQNSLFAASAQEDIAHSKRVGDLALEQAKMNTALAETAIRYGQATGAMGAHDAALKEFEAKQSELRAEYEAYGAEIAELQKQANAAVDDADHHQQLLDQIAALQSRRKELDVQYSASQEAYQEQTMSAMDQVFAHMAKGAQDLDTKIASITEHTLDSLNDQFVGAMFGDRTSFDKVFEQSGRSLAKLGLEWGEGSLFGKKSGRNINELSLTATNGALNVHIAGSSIPGSSGSGARVSLGDSAISLPPSVFSRIPGVTSFEDKIKNSSVGQWLQSNGGKYMPGVMDTTAGLMEMFSGPHHSKGEGSGVTNAVADASYRQNKLSRLLGSFGGMAQGAGSMMFAGAGGMQELNDSDAAGSLFGGRLFGPGGILEGYASGGPIGGVPIEVGEMGPEVWEPPESGGRIVPNRDLDRWGSGDHYTIDARGTDPALTQVNVARAIATSRQQAVREAQSRMIDRQTRVPRQ